MLRKNVSISDEHLRLLDPLLKKHRGNLSATMREIIDFTGFITENMGSLETAKDLLTEKSYAKEQTLHRIYGVTIPLTMFQWLLMDRKNTLPPINHATQLFATEKDINIYDVENLARMINEELSILNWPVKVAISNEDNNIAFQITGMDQSINRFTAILISLYLANNQTPYKISKLLLYPVSIYIQVTETARKEDAMHSIYEYFSENSDGFSIVSDIMQIKA
jgi:hypothetical protein